MFRAAFSGGDQAKKILRVHSRCVCVCGGGGGGGGEVFGLIFAGYVPLASQNTYTIFVYSVVIL